MTDMTPTSAERAAKLEGMGCKRKRVEDIRFVQGKGNYVDDLKLPGMLYGDFTPLAIPPNTVDDPPAEFNTAFCICRICVKNERTNMTSVNRKTPKAM